MEQLKIAPNGAVLSSCSKMNSWESNSTTEVPRLLNTGGYQPRIHRVLQLHQYTDPSRDHEKHRTIKNRAKRGISALLVVVFSVRRRDVAISFGQRMCNECASELLNLAEQNL